MQCHYSLQIHAAFLTNFAANSLSIAYVALQQMILLRTLIKICASCDRMRGMQRHTLWWPITPRQVSSLQVSLCIRVMDAVGVCAC